MDRYRAVVDEGRPFPGRPLGMMLMRVGMMIAVKPGIKAMSSNVDGVTVSRYIRADVR